MMNRGVHSALRHSPRSPGQSSVGPGPAAPGSTLPRTVTLRNPPSLSHREPSNLNLCRSAWVPGAEPPAPHVTVPYFISKSVACALEPGRLTEADSESGPPRTHRVRPHGHKVLRNYLPSP
eukprot:755441-Hanusia_phi.AAC.8